MNWKNTSHRYGSLAIGLHWLMLALLIGVYACIELREFYPKGSDPREALKTWHFMLGLSVFTLVLVRLLNRLVTPVPLTESRTVIWQRWFAGSMHVLLYAFLILMPLLGWLTLSAAGKPVPFFGLELPALVDPDKALAGRIKELHQTIGTLGYYLIGLHAVAALYHHYFLRDDTLRRMLPQRGTLVKTA